VDIITIRWQAAKPPDGQGLSIPLIATAWQASYETIRRIVKRQSYSWVGETQVAPPTDPRVQKALDEAILQSAGIDEAAMARFYAAQESAQTKRPPTSEALPPRMEAARKKIERQAAIYRGQADPQPSLQPSLQPEADLEPCGVDPTGSGFSCIYPKGHEGDHST